MGSGGSSLRFAGHRTISTFLRYDIASEEDINPKTEIVKPRQAVAGLLGPDRLVVVEQFVSEAA